eukprot:gene18929-25496_t
MTSKPVRKSSLLTHFRDCFFGFTDSAKEEHLIRLQVEYMKYPMVLFALAFCASGITKLMQTDLSQQNMLWSILLEPTSPLPNLCLVSALLFGSWQCAEPMAIIAGLMRFPSLMMWIICDQASVPVVVHRWEGAVSSADKLVDHAFFLAIGNSVLHVRFKFHLMLALAWILVAPTMVSRSPADISAWPFVLILVIAIMPTPPSAEPYSKDEAYHELQGGYPAAQTQSSRSASPVEPTQGASTADALVSNQAGAAATPRGQQPRHPTLAGGRRPSPRIQDKWYSISFLRSLLGGELHVLMIHLLPWLLNIRTVLCTQLHDGSCLEVDKKSLWNWVQL